jgi:hypothetical protein
MSPFPTAGFVSSHSTVRARQELSPAESAHRESLTFWDFRTSPGADAASGWPSHQDGNQSATSRSSASETSYAFPTMSPGSSLYGENNAPSPQNRNSSQPSTQDSAISWETPVSATSSFNPDIEMISVPHQRFGSFESFDSIAISNPSTVTSSTSGGYVFPRDNSFLGSSGGIAPLQDLSLPGM